MSKYNPYVLYTVGQLYDKDLIGETPDESYNRTTYDVIGMYKTVDEALEVLNTMNSHDNKHAKEFVWYIKSEAEFKKLMDI